jgi:hypothetical protein
LVNPASAFAMAVAAAVLFARRMCSPVCSLLRIRFFRSLSLLLDQSRVLSKADATADDPD